MAVGIKMMAQGPAPCGTVWPDLGQIISSLPASSLSAASQWEVTALITPFTTPYMSGDAFHHP